MTHTRFDAGGRVGNGPDSQLLSRAGRYPDEAESRFRLTPWVVA